MVPLGIYLHIPFCESKCDYCNFASGVYPESLVRPYLEALKEEAFHLRTLLCELGIPDDCVEATPVDTVYLGGGTPSFIPGQNIVEVLGFLREVFNFAPNPEITLEVNPGSVTPEKIKHYQEAGVNRISIGVQSFQDELLRSIGRSHSVREAIGTFKLFRKMGMKNLSLDLIAGLPCQTLNLWRENLRMIGRLAPEHVSLYILEIHENTVFGKVYGKGSSVGESLLQPELPGEDLIEQFYLEAIGCLQREGYSQYEISNFARPGFESRHNLKYWTDQPFIGFGCSAHSYLGGRRWGNERNVGRYIQLIHRQHHAIDFHSCLTPGQHEEEAFFLGLRMTQGMDLHQFEKNFGFDLRDRYKTEIDYLQDGGLIELSPERLRLTPKGYLLSNEVFSEFLQ